MTSIRRRMTSATSCEHAGVAMAHAVPAAVHARRGMHEDKAASLQLLIWNRAASSCYAAQIRCSHAWNCCCDSRAHMEWTNKKLHRCNRWHGMEQETPASQHEPVAAEQGVPDAVHALRGGAGKCSCISGIPAIHGHKR